MTDNENSQATETTGESGGGSATVYNVDMSGVEQRLDTITLALQDLNMNGMNKPFEDYTTTETLLTLLLVCVVVKWSVDMLRKGFSWLLS